jgi:hypothetical protein
MLEEFFGILFLIIGCALPLWALIWKRHLFRLRENWWILLALVLLCLVWGIVLINDGDPALEVFK